ncbi:MAG TPA: hypothetical protein DHV36_00175 [Desulfobacteraceae bacterium]|nr:hypothetical protein [Desulfobacteraceae bacterium]|tara:strand:+ start:694 stop:2346 length:1653 start_codon:yes stop_codon:yes gene_type:complete
MRRLFVHYIQYLYLAAALAATAGSVWAPHLVLQLLLGWGAVSFWLVTSAYFMNAGWIFRKRSDGSIPVYVRWLFIPVFFIIRGYHMWALGKDDPPPLQKIDDHLFLARRLLVSEMDKIEAGKIDAVLDVTAEFGAPDWTIAGETIHYLNIPVLDHKIPSKSQLIQAVNWIHRHVKTGKNVMVHCALGRGRSVLVMAAYLLSRDPDLDVETALSKISGIRGTARLNPRQLKLLNRLYQDAALILRQQAWIIANPASGGGKWDRYRTEIVDALTPYFTLEINTTSKDRDAEEIARDAVDAGADLVIACGGDGTVSNTAGVLVRTKVAMGIIPLGTTNALAHVLWGIRSKLAPVATACDIIVKGVRKSIDTGRCNGKVFLLITGIGFEQQMIAYADREEKDNMGQLAYIKGLFQAVGRNRPIHLDLCADENPAEKIVTTSLIVANAAPFSTLLAQGGGAPDHQDGLLDITWIEYADGTGPVFSLVELGLAAMEIGYRGDRVRHLHARRLLITGDSSIEYAMDGEPHTADALDISIQPASLNVLLPEEDIIATP